MITGGTGFIGSHTCIQLINKGYSLVIIDSLVNSSSGVIDKILHLSKKPNADSYPQLRFCEGDLRDKEFLNHIFKKYSNKFEKIEAVIHFAGLKSVFESINYPLKYWEYNVKGTINLLNVMQNYGCYRIVFSSSATIYGSNKNQFLIKETNKIKPINPYGKTKEVIENILDSLGDSKESKWRIAILRYFNPVGAHSSGLIGENPLNTPTNIMPILNKVAGNKMSNFQIFGNDWETRDGTCIRDYIHIMDLAEGHLQALKSILEDKFKIIKLNLGTGKGTTVLELLRTFERVNNIKIPFTYISRRDGDIPHSVADNSLAKIKLNWSPKRDLKDMCIDSWNWYQKNIDKF